MIENEDDIFFDEDEGEDEKEIEEIDEGFLDSINEKQQIQSRLDDDEEFSFWFLIIFLTFIILIIGFSSLAIVRARYAKRLL